jgi:FKBP-type peptidyl-prolyl cis-trans isomerase SlyD
MLNKEESFMSIKPDQVVTINVTIKDEEGQPVESTANEEPLSFLSGHNQIFPKLEDKLGEMIIGSKKTVNLKPEEAFGEYKDEAIQQVKRSNFSEENPPQEGRRYLASTPEGKQMPFVVKSVEEDDVTVDFNHPLAGKELTVEMELLNIREATKDELSGGQISSDPYKN